MSKRANHGMPLVAALAATMMVGAPASAQEQETEENNPFNAVVKLEVTTSTHDIRSPWEKRMGSCTGSGVVIDQGRILTCAHCVADATFIRIRKQNEENTYQGKVEFVSHGCDLALVRVDDPDFMRNVTPSVIGDTPTVQTEVVAVGYPIGGYGISYTRGIVSRVEAERYAHSRQAHLAVQVDAAINPGNSGGPVFGMKDGLIAGIAFQGDEDGESLGYLIPPDVIRHFLKDIEDGRVDGSPTTPFSIDDLENAETRRFLKMKDGQTGCLIVDVDSDDTADKIRRGDVLLSFCGYQVGNTGYIRDAKNQRRIFWHPLDLLQLGEEYPVTVLRDGKELSFTLKSRPVNRKVRPYMYDQKPNYYVFGGYVFTTASLTFLDLNPPFDSNALFGYKESPDDEPVVLADVMADDATDGYLSYGGSLVKSVNGEKVRNIKQLIKLLENSKDEFICMEVDSGNRYTNPIYMNREQQKKATQGILKKYAIPADRSEDLANP